MSMATIVIVHGGWGGGWEWTDVARRLRTQGHEVFTPTLTGLGDRSHLTGTINLSTHIADVLALFTFEALNDVVLCGHSYGGMVVTGAADQVPDKCKCIIYLDAFVPRDGESLRDHFPELVDPLTARAAERADGRAPLPDELVPPADEVDEALRAYMARVRPHPIATMTDPIQLTGAIERLPRAYVHCTGGGDVMGAIAARARTDGWLYRQMPTPHDLQLYDPDGTAKVIDELAHELS
jgi:pimeloyl-ACP methyl ester carboxylesterase